MKIESIRGSIPSKTVVVTLPTDRTVSNDLVIGFAMAKADETPGSLYGWQMLTSPDGKTATVRLYTD